MKKNFLAFALVASILFLAGIVSSASAQVKVSDIQAAIKAAGANWTAGENKITRLTPDQQKGLLGVLKPPKPIAHPRMSAASAYGLPPSLDWRNNGGNYVTGVRNQGVCGSCWAHASIAALESATLINKKTPNTELNLSEQGLISCCSHNCSPYTQCQGGYIDKAADFLQNTGVMTETCFPYTSGAQYLDRLCSDACGNWQTSAYAVKSWEWIVNDEQDEAPSVDAIKAGLQNGPLVTTYAVWSDFMHYAGGVYKSTTGTLAGYHAVLVVGYDDPGQYFIVKNSWDSDWGEQGFFRIAYSEVTGLSQFGYQTIAYHMTDNPNGICAYDVAESFPASGGTGTIQTAMNAGFAWSASTEDYWITVSQQTGNGAGTIPFSVAVNAGTLPRIGNVIFLFGDSTVGYRQVAYTIYQEGASGQCTYAISPTSQALDNQGGSGSISVTTQPGCPWTAVAMGLQIQSVEPASGTGSGTVKYNVYRSQLSWPLTSGIKVADKDFTITQTGCPVSGASGGSIGADGGTNTVNVSADPICEWMATSNVPWITMTGAPLYQGNGSFSYLVAANTGTLMRTGTITVGGKTYTVTQAGGSGCAFSISPTSQSFNWSSGNGQGGTDGTISVTASSPSCTWQVVRNVSWLGPYAAGGLGSGTFKYMVNDNYTTTPRTGTMTVAGKTFTATQDGGSCIPMLSPTGQAFASAGGTGTINVSAPSGCSWTAKVYADGGFGFWLTLTSASGTGNGSVSYAVQPNATPANRSGLIFVSASGTWQDQKFTVTQAGQGCASSPTISPTSASLTAAGGTGTVTVTAGTGCTFSASSSVDWIKVTSGANGSTYGNVGYSVAANTTTTARNGTITIGGQTFTVTQARQGCTVSPGFTNVSVGAEGGPGTMNVTAGTGCTWSASSGVDWITVTSSGGSGNGTFSYSVAANTATASRTGTLTIPGWTITVTQKGQGSCSYTATPMTQNVNAAAGTGSVTITAASDCLWSVMSASDWITLTSGRSGFGNGTVSFAFQANTSTASRSGSLWLISQSGGYVAFSGVTQAGQTNCNYSITPTSNSSGASGGSGTVNVSAGTGCSWSASSSATWITISSGASGSGNGSVNYTVAANSTTTSRTGTMTIANQTFTVTQAGVTQCVYTISPTSQNFTTPNSATGTVNVTAGAGCAWSASSGAGWMTISSGGNGSGNGTVNYSVAANSTTTSRTGTMTIANQTFTVTQAGASPCTYAITPTSQHFTTAGGTGTFAVTTGATCSWSPTSNAAWITISQGVRASGNGSVNYLVTANAGAVSRAGTITVGDKTFTVNQDGVGCTYSITPTSNSVGASAGTGSVAVTAPAGCTWTASSSASWITVSSGSSGSGNGTVNYAVAANTTIAQRAGTMTIAGQTFTVNQAGASCTLSITPTSSSVSAGATTGSVTVTAPSGCTWSAASTAGWLTVASGASGSGNGTVNYAVAANTATTSRTGTMTIANQTFTLTQSGVYTCSVSLNYWMFNLPYSSTPQTGALRVSADTSCPWTASANVPWISFTGGSGTGTGSVSFTVGVNNGAARTGTISINGTTVTVNEAGGGSCTYAISPTSQNFSTPNTGTGTVNVTAGSGCAWSASSNAGWITISGASSGSGNGTVSYSVTANTATTSRTGTLTIAGQTFTVSQAGATPTCTYTITPTSQNFTTSASGTGTVTVTAGSGCAWTAASNAPSWLNVTSGANGSGNGTVGYSVTTNTATSSRTGTMTIAGQTFTITQAGQTACTYTLSPTSQNFTTSGGTGTFSVAAGSTCSWSATSNASWITIGQGVRASGNGSVNYSVAANTGASRTGTITVADKTFTVTQDGTSPCTYAITPTSQNVSSSAATGTVSVTAGAGCAWSAASNAGWITITSGANGSGNGTVNYSVAANSGVSRNGTLSIGGKTFTVTQAGTAPTCGVTLSVWMYNMGYFTQQASFKVTASSGCSWTASANVPWIKFTSGATGTGNGTVTFTTDTNTGSARSGTINVNGTTLTVSQGGAPGK